MSERNTHINDNDNKQRAKATKRDIISRVKSLYGILFLLALAVVIRLVWIILFSPSVIHNAAVLEDGVYRTNIVKARRGTIFSRDGEPLAISSLRYKVILDFGSEGIHQADTNQYLKSAERLSKLLAAHFNEEDAREHGYKYISAEEYNKTLTKEFYREGKKRRAYEIMPRTITIDEWNMMQRTFPLFDGKMGYIYGSTNDNERIYPSEDLARQIIGRYDTLIIKDKDKDRVIPGSGIEGQYNKYLKGVNGQKKEQWIAHGFWARVYDEDNIPVQDGADVITTLDAGIQRMAHERLDSMLRQEQASFGVAIVMEVQSGNILSMVSLGSGIERGTTYSERVNNHALKTAISPGSTMKLATTMALLEIGGYDLDTKVNTEHSRPGKKVKVGAANIEDSHDVAGKESDGNVTLLEAFAHSSNVYFAKAVYEKFKDNPAEYTDYLAKLRFNDYVGLEAYGEERGRLISANDPKWNTKGSTSSRLPRMAYGYELDIPAIHMITFYNGVANRGRMVAPRLVDRIERNGEVIERMPVVPLVERMCSQKTITQLDSCLAAAAQRSTHRFRDLAIPFGCKTGTAQVWSVFTSDSRIDKKQMENGLNDKDKYYYGSIVCTMPLENPCYTILVGVCKQITTESTRHFGIDVAAPVASDIMEYIYTTDPSLHYILESPTQEYTPTAIKISAEDIEVSEGRIPNVKGLGLTDAIYILERSGLKVTHSGSGKVKSQSIPAGREITSKDLTIHLNLGR